MDTNSKIKRIIDTGVALSSMKDKNALFDMIIDACMEITECDGGTLYICKEDCLEFKIMKTVSLNIDKGKRGEIINLPPVSLSPENICAYSAMNKEILNIKDVYNSDLFDFSGPKKYDSLNGYHTQSMMTIPLVDGDDKCQGVLQLINALDENGNIIPFDKELEDIVLALASQAAIALSNLIYQKDLKQMIWSFTEAMTEAVDANTPYNGSHSRNVARLAGILADKINEHYLLGDIDELFDENRKNALLMGAYLHDIGKVAIPHSVMNKPDRLGERAELLFIKLKYYQAISKTESDVDKINQAIEIAKVINDAGYVNDELYDALLKIIDEKIETTEGIKDIFSEEEKECLMIRKGTLTDAERKVMQSHVEMTKRILSKVYFTEKFKFSPEFAAQHHEALDGSGYPDGVKSDKLHFESKILAVVDVCDALMAVDRPYKKPMPIDKVFDILHDMALKEGKLDNTLVTYLEEAIREV